MIKVGIFGNEDDTEILENLKKLYQVSNMKICILNQSLKKDLEFNAVNYFESIEQSGYEIVIIHLSPSVLQRGLFHQTKFEILIYSYYSEEGSIQNREYDEQNHLCKLLHSKDFVILQTEETEVLKQLVGKKVSVITYGLHNKATMTASSMEEEEITCCIQRTIFTYSGKEIEPQEFQVHIQQQGKDQVDKILSTAIAGILTDVPIENMQKLFL